MKILIAILFLLVSCTTSNGYMWGVKVPRPKNAEACAENLSRSMSPDIATEFCKDIYDYVPKIIIKTGKI